jgi:hypothetical protein
MSQESAVTWLTQEAYDRLSAELGELSGHGRTEIAKKIEQAREEGDLRENGGYHAAKEEQGKIEARIRQLTQLLRSAEVGVAQAPRARSCSATARSRATRTSTSTARRARSGTPSPAQRSATRSPTRRRTAARSRCGSSGSSPTPPERHTTMTRGS